MAQDFRNENNALETHYTKGQSYLQNHNSLGAQLQGHFDDYAAAVKDSRSGTAIQQQGASFMHHHTKLGKSYSHLLEAIKGTQVKTTAASEEGGQRIAALKLGFN